MTPWNTTTPRDDGVTTVRRSWRAEIVHPDGTVTVEGAQLAAACGRGGDPVTIAKAITAALIAALGALAAAAGDGISVQEGLTAAVAGLVALGGVWAVPNAKPLPPPNPADKEG